jgi:transcriptional regulator with XRE-family HTH domain
MGAVTATSFAAVLTELRKRAGLRQFQLADAIGVHHASISRLESGERVPSLAMVRKIAHGLQLAPGSPERDRLLIGASFTPYTPALLLAMPALADLDDLFSAAGPETRDWIAHFIQVALEGGRKLEQKRAA